MKVTIEVEVGAWGACQKDQWFYLERDGHIGSFMPDRLACSKEAAPLSISGNQRLVEAANAEEAALALKVGDRIATIIPVAGVYARCFRGLLMGIEMMKAGEDISSSNNTYVYIGPLPEETPYEEVLRGTPKQTNAPRTVMPGPWLYRYSIANDPGVI